MKKYTPPQSDSLLQESAAAYRPASKIDQARRGILMHDLLSIADRLGLRLSDLSPIMHASLRSLQRYSDDKVLDTDMSSTVIMLRDLHRLGVETLGSDAALAAWLRYEVPALGCTPLSLLDTPFGFTEVTDMLGRIAHGVYA